MAVVLTGCSKNDQAYYADNLDKAEEKIAECKADMMQAINDLDNDAVMMKLIVIFPEQQLMTLRKTR